MERWEEWSAIAVDWWINEPQQGERVVSVDNVKATALKEN